MQDPAQSTEGESETDDPYEQLENVFDEPIVLEDADVRTFEPEETPPAQVPVDGVVEQLTAVERVDEVTRRLWARLEALEGEVRGGSERTLESLRRLGERMGAELAMLDKRAINLELTLARLRSITESVEAGVRRLPEPRAPSSVPPEQVPATEQAPKPAGPAQTSLGWSPPPDPEPTHRSEHPSPEPPEADAPDER